MTDIFPPLPKQCKISIPPWPKGQMGIASDVGINGKTSIIEYVIDADGAMTITDAFDIPALRR